MRIAAPTLHGCAHALEKLRIPKKVWVVLGLCGSGEAFEERVQPIDFSKFRAENDFEKAMQIRKSAVSGARRYMSQFF
jgi:hypothetical protein